jgi:hypothetical protein
MVMRRSLPKPPRDDVYGKPDLEDVYGKRDRRDVYPGPTDTIRNFDRNKRANPKPKPKPERRPVDERGVVRRGPGGPAKTVAPKKRGMNRMEGPVRKRDDFDKRGPVKPKTAEEKKFIMDQLRKNPSRPDGGVKPGPRPNNSAPTTRDPNQLPLRPKGPGGRPGGRTTPVMPRRGR